MIEGDQAKHPDKNIINLGHVYRDSYETVADQSEIPTNTAGILKTWLLKYEGIPYKDIAESIFGVEFDSDLEGEIAIKYTQAISNIKQYGEMEEDNINFDQKLLLSIGDLVELEEDVGEESEIAKEKVEAYFANPVNSMSFVFYLGYSKGRN